MKVFKNFIFAFIGTKNISPRHYGFQYYYRHLSSSVKLSCTVNLSNCSEEIINKNSTCILGIETSCDDTGAAIVNEHGDILGEKLYSQIEASTKFGGVLPSIASKYHEKNIGKAVNEAFEKSNLTPDKLTAVAVTVKPGNIRLLRIGCEYGRKLALQYKLPFIPIHHMEAHALTVRMNNQIEFPFTVLLVSGGHCVLSIAHSIDEWSIIGDTSGLAPGAAFNQVARRLKLRNLPEIGHISGGRAIEFLAKDGDPKRYEFDMAKLMQKHKDSNFNFSKLELFAKKLILKLEEEKGIEGGRLLDKECLKDLCASFQYSVVIHMIRRVQKGIKFAEYTGRIPPENKSLVISGGVASNQFLRDAFEILCKEEGYKLFVPPPKLCTDNGVMIAWNGIERWKAGKGILYNEEDIKNVVVEHRCPLGPNLSEEHRSLKIPRPKWIKICT